MMSLNEIQCILDCIFLHVQNIKSKSIGMNTINRTIIHLQNQKKVKCWLSCKLKKDVFWFILFLMSFSKVN